MGAPPAAPILIALLIAILAAFLSLIVLGVLIVRATNLSLRDRKDRRRREASLDMDYEIRPDRPGKPMAAWDRDLDG